MVNDLHAEMKDIYIPLGQFFSKPVKCSVDKRVIRVKKENVVFAGMLNAGLSRLKTPFI